MFSKAFEEFRSASLVPDCLSYFGPHRSLIKNDFIFPQLTPSTLVQAVVLGSDTCKLYLKIVRFRKSPLDESVYNRISEAVCKTRFSELQMTPSQYIDSVSVYDTSGYNLCGFVYPCDQKYEDFSRLTKNDLVCAAIKEVSQETGHVVLTFCPTFAPLILLLNLIPLNLGLCSDSLWTATQVPQTSPIPEPSLETWSRHNHRSLDAFCSMIDVDHHLVLHPMFNDFHPSWGDFYCAKEETNNLFGGSHLSKAKKFITSSNFSLAFPCLFNAVDSAPGSVVTWLNLSSAFYQIRLFVPALAACRMALSLQPDNRVSLRWLSSILQSLSMCKPLNMVEGDVVWKYIKGEILLEETYAPATSSIAGVSKDFLELVTDVLREDVSGFSSFDDSQSQ
ncbi:hypothetical protein RCL1_005736 [Eukaryota sp. TZLM3-RCL]